MLQVASHNPELARAHGYGPAGAQALGANASSASDPDDRRREREVGGTQSAIEKQFLQQALQLGLSQKEARELQSAGVSGATTLAFAQFAKSQDLSERDRQQFSQHMAALYRNTSDPQQRQQYDQLLQNYFQHPHDPAAKAALTNHLQTTISQGGKNAVAAKQLLGDIGKIKSENVHKHQNTTREQQSANREQQSAAREQ